MQIKRLKNIAIENFRIFEKVECSLDADIVLFYGPNGSGKSSLLNAIELAISGQVRDLYKLEEDYPKCLVHIGKSKASISLKFTDTNNQEKVINVSVGIKNRQVICDSVIEKEQAHYFSERAFLSQIQLTRLLEAYQTPESDSKNKEQPVIRMIRELLGLDVLDNLVDGIHDIKDIRRFKKVSAKYRSFLEEKKEITENLKDVIRRKKDILNKFGILKTKIFKECELLKIEIDELDTLQQQEGLAKIIKSLRKGKELSQLVKLSSQLESIHEQWNELSQRIDEKELENSKIQVKRIIDAQEEIVDKLAKIIDSVTAALSENGPKLPVIKTKNFISRFDAISEYLENTSEKYNDQITIAKDNQNLLEGFEKQELEKVSMMEELEKKSRRSTADSIFRTKTLEAALEDLDKDECPVCGRDYGELEKGSLNEHIKKELRRLGRDIKSMENESIQRSTLVDEIGKIRSEISILKKQILAHENRYRSARKYKDIIETQLKKLQKNYEYYNKYIEYSEEKNELEERITELKSANKEGKSVDLQLNRVKDSAKDILGDNVVAELENTVKLENYIRDLVDNYELKNDRLADLSELIDELINLQSKRLKNLESEVVKLESKKDKFANIENHFDNLREKICELSDKSKHTQELLLSRVFTEELNNLWKDIFRRLAKSETFFPLFSKPTIEYGKIKTMLQASINEGDKTNTFNNAISVLSSGNAITASLSLFLALYLIERSKIPLLVLDDPVQNLDDVHIIQLAALLKRIVRETDRQLFLSIHDRELFNYLRMELAPGNESESILAVEITRKGRLAEIDYRYDRWVPDKIKVAS